MKTVATVFGATPVCVIMYITPLEINISIGNWEVLLVGIVNKLTSISNVVFANVSSKQLYCLTAICQIGDTNLITSTHILVCDLTMSPATLVNESKCIIGVATPVFISYEIIERSEEFGPCHPCCE